MIDLLDRRIINFDNIRFVVLDEVDRMLDIGFRDDIRNILSRVKGVRRAADRRTRTRRSGTTTATAATSDADDATSSTATATATAHRQSTRRIDDGHVDPHADRSGHQTIFVSATISDEIERLARRYMREPVEKLIAPGADDKPTVEKVEQYYLLRPAVGQVPAAADAAGAARTRTWRSSSAGPSAARRSWPSGCTPTGSSAARSTATSRRTSATA